MEESEGERLHHLNHTRSSLHCKVCKYTTRKFHGPRTFALSLDCSRTSRPLSTAIQPPNSQPYPGPLHTYAQLVSYYTGDRQACPALIRPGRRALRLSSSK